MLFLLRLGTRHRCLLLSLLFNIVLEVVASSTKHEKEMKYWKARYKAIFTKDKIIYVENPKETLKVTRTSK